MFDTLVNVIEQFSVIELTIYEKWKDLMDNKSDYRTRTWFTMQSPFPAIIFGLLYIHFATVSDGISE